MRRVGHSCGVASWVAAIAMVATLTGPARAGDWSQLGADAGQTYAQPNETLIDIDSVASLAPAWAADVVAPRYQEIGGGPAVNAGVVYVAGFGRVIDEAWVTRLYALDLDSGAALWSARLPGVTRWTPAVEGGTVIVALEQPEVPLSLFAFDASSGEPRWARPLSCRGCSPYRGDTWPAIVADGVVVAAMGGAFRGGTYDPYGRIWAIDLRDGSLLWSRMIRSPGLPIIVDGAVIVNEESRSMNADESVFAFELRSGDERWRRSKEIAWVVSLSGAGQEVFVATGYRLLSLSTGDGSLRWKRWMRGVVGAPAVGPRSLFVAGYGSNRSASAVAGLDRATGEVRWTRDVDDFGYTMLTTTPPLVNGVLFVGGRYEYGDSSTRRPPTYDSFAVGALRGRVVARLPLGLAGLEYFNVAIADGFVVKTQAALVSAFTVPPRHDARNE
jgi:outer membrane protein assembly factor BamB